MLEYGALFLSAVLVNNFVLTRFLGLCIFFGVSKSFDASAGMGVALTAVMTIASFLAWAMYNLVLAPLHLEFFTTICFVLIIASTVQLLDVITRRFLPTLHAMWGIYLMLIATNCIVLSVPLINVENGFELGKSLVHAVGAGVGFALALLLMASIRERLQYAKVPKAFEGLGIAFITAGLLSLAFLGFSGMIPM
ncbi:MAG: electron transport complex protein RnfA [Myxococcota bacterium]|jgi:electron transport complex protein RnfA